MSPDQPAGAPPPLTLEAMSPVAATRRTAAPCGPTRSRGRTLGVSRALTGDVDVDVAIVGAGLTGLWTAGTCCEPTRRCGSPCVERETVGFGASGRNGGWCSALLPMSLASIEAAARTRRPRRACSRRCTTTSTRSVAFGAEHGIGDALPSRRHDHARARTPPQVERLQARRRRARALRIRRLTTTGSTPTRPAARATPPTCSARVHTRTCATVHPLRLTHAVAARRRRGAGSRILERTAVEEIGPRRVTTAGGTSDAEVVVRATEGYTAQFAGEHRDLMPIYSLMIATEPLDDEHVGGDRARRPADVPRRPAPDHLRPAHDRRAHRLRRARRAVPLRFDGRPGVRHRRRRAASCSPTACATCSRCCSDTAITHHWGGVARRLPRDWTPLGPFDRPPGFATAGGYVGDGVATTNLAGRTLAA